MNWFFILLLLGAAFRISTQQNCQSLSGSERKIYFKKLKILFNGGDTDCDGYLTLKEYLILKQQFDVDGDGFLKEWELIQTLQGVGDSLLTTPTLTATFLYGDTLGGTRNPVGYILMSRNANIFEQTDINNDEKLSSDEYVYHWINVAQAGYTLFINPCCPQFDYGKD